MNFIGEELEETRHIEYYLLWCKSVLLQHGAHIKANSNDFMPILNLLVKNISTKSENLAKICDHNKYTLKYLLTVGSKKDSATDASEMECAGEQNDCDREDEEEDVDMSELQSKWSDDDEMDEDAIQ